eukprot:PhM_4_TR16235/c0_g1_i1/m.98576
MAAQLLVFAVVLLISHSVSALPTSLSIMADNLTPEVQGDVVVWPSDPFIVRVFPYVADTTYFLYVSVMCTYPSILPSMVVRPLSCWRNSSVSWDCSFILDSTNVSAARPVLYSRPFDVCVHDGTDGVETTAGIDIRMPFRTYNLPYGKGDLSAAERPVPVVHNGPIYLLAGQSTFVRLDGDYLIDFFVSAGGVAFVSDRRCGQFVAELSKLAVTATFISFSYTASKVLSGQTYHICLQRANFSAFSISSLTGLGADSITVSDNDVRPTSVVVNNITNVSYLLFDTEFSVDLVFPPYSDTTSRVVAVDYSLTYCANVTEVPGSRLNITLPPSAQSTTVRWNITINYTNTLGLDLGNWAISFCLLVRTNVTVGHPYYTWLPLNDYERFIHVCPEHHAHVRGVGCVACPTYKGIPCNAPHGTCAEPDITLELYQTGQCACLLPYRGAACGIRVCFTQPSLSPPEQPSTTLTSPVLVKVIASPSEATECLPYHRIERDGIDTVGTVQGDSVFLHRSGTYTVHAWVGGPPETNDNSSVVSGTYVLHLVAHAPVITTPPADVVGLTTAGPLAISLDPWTPHDNPNATCQAYYNITFSTLLEAFPPTLWLSDQQSDSRDVLRVMPSLEDTVYISAWTECGGYDNSITTARTVSFSPSMLISPTFSPASGTRIRVNTTVRVTGQPYVRISTSTSDDDGHNVSTRFVALQDVGASQQVRAQSYYYHHVSPIVDASYHVVAVATTPMVTPIIPTNSLSDAGFKIECPTSNTTVVFGLNSSWPLQSTHEQLVTEMGLPPGITTVNARCDVDDATRDLMDASDVVSEVIVIQFVLSAALASPPPGTYTDTPIVVVFSHEQVGVVVKSTPPSGTVLSAPGMFSFVAVAEGEGFRPSPPTTYTYRIYKSSPGVAFSVDEPVLGTTRVNMTCSGCNGDIEYQVATPSTGNQTYTAPILFTVVGRYDISAWCRCHDNPPFWLWSSEPSRTVVVVEDVPPPPPPSMQPPSGVYLLPLTVTAVPSVPDDGGVTTIVTCNDTLSYSVNLEISWRHVACHSVRLGKSSVEATVSVFFLVHRAPAVTITYNNNTRIATLISLCLSLGCSIRCSLDGSAPYSTLRVHIPVDGETLLRCHAWYSPCSDSIGPETSVVIYNAPTLSVDDGASDSYTPRVAFLWWALYYSLPVPSLRIPMAVSHTKHHVYVCYSPPQAVPNLASWGLAFVMSDFWQSRQLPSATSPEHCNNDSTAVAPTAWRALDPYDKTALSLSTTVFTRNVTIARLGALFRVLDSYAAVNGVRGGDDLTDLASTNVTALVSSLEASGGLLVDGLPVAEAVEYPDEIAPRLRRACVVLTQLYMVNVVLNASASSSSDSQPLFSSSRQALVSLLSKLLLWSSRLVMHCGATPQQYQESSSGRPTSSSCTPFAECVYTNINNMVTLLKRGSDNVDTRGPADGVATCAADAASVLDADCEEEPVIYPVVTIRTTPNKPLLLVLQTGDSVVFSWGWEEGTQQTRLAVVLHGEVHYCPVTTTTTDYHHLALIVDTTRRSIEFIQTFEDGNISLATVVLPATAAVVEKGGLSCLDIMGPGNNNNFIRLSRGRLSVAALLSRSIPTQRIAIPNLLNSRPSEPEHLKVVWSVPPGTTVNVTTAQNSWHTRSDLISVSAVLSPGWLLDPSLVSCSCGNNHHYKNCTVSNALQTFADDVDASAVVFVSWRLSATVLGHTLCRVFALQGINATYVLQTVPPNVTRDMLIPSESELFFSSYSASQRVMSAAATAAGLANVVFGAIGNHSLLQMKFSHGCGDNTSTTTSILVKPNECITAWLELTIIIINTTSTTSSTIVLLSSPVKAQICFPYRPFGPLAVSVVTTQKSSTPSLIVNVVRRQTALQKGTEKDKDGNRRRSHHHHLFFFFLIVASMCALIIVAVDFLRII